MSVAVSLSWAPRKHRYSLWNRNSNLHIARVITTSGLDITNPTILISSHIENVLHVSHVIIDLGDSENISIATGISFLSDMHQLL